MEAPPRSEKVRNRAELRRVLENSLVSPEPEKKKLVTVEGEEDRSVKPKTYLIESNTAIKNIAGNGYELIPTEDNTLWNLRAYSSYGNPTPFYLYIDTLDKRYWVVHSAFYARESDSVIDGLVSYNQSNLDYAWLSSDALQQLSIGMVPTGFGISYSDLFSQEDGNSISARFWASGIPDVLNGLRNIPNIKNQISLNSIALRYISTAGYVNEDIFRWGKVTAKGGDSVDNHFGLIASIKDYYSGLIQEIEDKYTTRYEYSENYCNLHGSYSVIEFSNPAPNLARFANILTAGSEPFRIWGIWRNISFDHIKVKALDQHTNTPIELEIMPDQMRVILGKGACGNIVTRLFTNIQASFDANCKLKGLDDAYIIRPHPAS